MCEMLHAALLREKKLEFIQSFKARYREKFSGKMPVFVPFATVLSVEPVCADFSLAMAIKDQLDIEVKKV